METTTPTTMQEASTTTMMNDGMVEEKMKVEKMPIMNMPIKISSGLPETHVEISLDEVEGRDLVKIVGRGACT